MLEIFFFFSSRRRHTRWPRDWSSDVCSSDLPIYDPGEQNQTISNQIVVHPDGTLVDGFLLIKTHQNNRRSRGFSAAVIRSFDKGESWSRRAIIVAPVSAIGETDPEPIHCRPYITGDPLCTLVRSDGVI